MADEIAQVCQMEIEGTTMVIKGSVKVISWLAQAIKALLQNAAERKTEHGGEKHDMRDIWKLSKDGPPQVIQVDEKNLQTVLSAAAKQGLRWTRATDFDGCDGKVPICLPPQDMAMFSAIVQASLHKDISESQKILDSYNEEISELKEKLLHADAGERNSIRTRIENLEQARDELMNILEEKKSMAENGGIMSFQDYLATAAGTEFEKDPEKAMAEFAKGVEMGPKVTAKECMQPIRSKAAMPDSEVRFYSPEMGVAVTRKFEVENDIVYSIYSFKTEKGELYEFSDKGMTKAEWNTQTLPQMLDKAGILLDTPCRMFDSEKSLQIYEKYYNNTPIASEEKLAESYELGFSSAEAQKNILSAMGDKMKELFSAGIDENKINISISAEQMIQRDGKISVQVGDSLFQFEGVIPKAKDDGMYTLVLGKESMVTVKDRDGGEKQISAMRAQKVISSVQQGMTETPDIIFSSQRGAGKSSLLEAAQAGALPMKTNLPAKR